MCARSPFTTAVLSALCRAGPPLRQALVAVARRPQVAEGIYQPEALTVLVVADAAVEHHPHFGVDGSFRLQRE